MNYSTKALYRFYQKYGKYTRIKDLFSIMKSLYIHMFLVLGSSLQEVDGPSNRFIWKCFSDICGLIYLGSNQKKHCFMYIDMAPTSYIAQRLIKLLVCSEKVNIRAKQNLLRHSDVAIGPHSSSFRNATSGRSQDGGGIGRGDHFLFYKFIERTIERWTKFTKQLLIASSGHQAPRKAAHCLRREVGQKY